MLGRVLRSQLLIVVVVAVAAVVAVVVVVDAVGYGGRVAGVAAGAIKSSAKDQRAAGQWEVISCPFRSCLPQSHLVLWNPCPRAWWAFLRP